MNKRYTISFRYTKPGENEPGPAQRYVIYAADMEEAKQLMQQYATYPNLQIIDIKET